jgi:hypothetical protein
MPSADQHRNKANSNRKFLDGISLEDFPDWVVVAAFYTVVHFPRFQYCGSHLCLVACQE